MAMKLSNKRSTALFAAVSVVGLIVTMAGVVTPANAAATYKIGVSNNWAGNAWREEMVVPLRQKLLLVARLQKSQYFRETLTLLVNQQMYAA